MSIDAYLIEQPSLKKSISVFATLAIGGVVLMGTGSIYEIESAHNWVPYVQPRVPFLRDEIEVPTTPRLDIRTAIEHIENIRHVFDPSILDLANLLDVSRQAIYKWLAGSSMPEKEKLDRIIVLSRIADQFQEAKISRAGSFLKMKLFGEKSLMDILMTGEDTNHYVTALINEANLMKAAYKQSGLSSSKAKPTSDWQSYISIPGSPEKNN